MDRLTPGPCSRCGALLPGDDEGCWAAFHAILAREYSDLAYAAVNLLTVDAHALQHPEDHGVKNNAFHLLRLCWLLEHGGDPRLGQGPRWLQRRFDGDVEVPRLHPPAHRGAITEADMNTNASPGEYAAQARRWSQSVWDAWHAQHDWARRWLQTDRPQV